jgi:DNA-binding response OmpR family regulator
VKPLVLHVEDDPAIRETTAMALDALGFDVQQSADGQAGLDAFRASAPDVALLDVMLPRIDGITLTRLIREQSLVPVILLSARSDPLDVVAGLQAGADDYVTKPYNGPVLAARLQAVLRRAERHAAVDPKLRFDNLEIDPLALTATVDGSDARLTTTEFRLLLELARNAGIVLGRGALLSSVWGYEWGGDTRLVDVHVQRLRAKIGRSTIETVRGVGYRLVP